MLDELPEEGIHLRTDKPKRAYYVGFVDMCKNTQLKHLRKVCICAQSQGKEKAVFGYSFYCCKDYFDISIKCTYAWVTCKRYGALGLWLSSDKVQTRPV